MQAVVLMRPGGVENFELQEAPDPVLLPGTVLLAVSAAAFNPIDYQMRRGDPESKLLRSAILGRELSGIVLEVGDGVQGFAPGDAVYGYLSNLSSNGSYAGRVVVPAALLAHKPQTRSFAEAAALPLVALTAIQALEKTAPAPGERILVTGGAGGVGSMLLRLLLRDGHSNILTTAGNEASRTAIRSFGLPDDCIINYRNEDIIEVARQRWHNAPADLVLDTVGGAAALQAVGLLRAHGRFADVTFHLDGETRAALFDKGITVYSIANYASAAAGDLEYYGTRLRQLARDIDEGKLAPSPVHIVGALSAATVAEAHRMLEENRSGGKKLVMLVEE